MNKEIEDIIKNMDYSSLNESERELVSEWANSPEEYAILQQIIIHAPKMHADLSPSAKVKTSLMETFAHVHSQSAASTSFANKEKGRLVNVWFKVLLTSAAVLLTILLIYPVFTKKNPVNQVAENQTKENNKEKRIKVPEKVVASKWKENSDIQNPKLAKLEPRAIRHRLNNENTPPQFESAYSNVDEEKFNYEQVQIDVQQPMASIRKSAAADVSINNVTERKDHSDRIQASDLPNHLRPVILNQPEILNFLHTSF